MMEGQGQKTTYKGVVWVDGEMHIMFSVEADGVDQAQAIGAARFGNEHTITIHEMRKPGELEAMIEHTSLPGEHDPLKEYVGKLWVDGEPVRHISVMARNPREARELAKSQYGDHWMSIWNEEELSRIR